MSFPISIPSEQVEAVAEQLRRVRGCENSEIVGVVSAENFASLQGIALSGDIRVCGTGEPTIKPEKHCPWLRAGKGRGRSL